MVQSLGAPCFWIYSCACMCKEPPPWTPCGLIPGLTLELTRGPAPGPTLWPFLKPTPEHACFVLPPDPLGTTRTPTTEPVFGSGPSPIPIRRPTSGPIPLPPLAPGLMLLFQPPQRGNTALHIAAIHGKADMCQVLLDNGAKVNVTCKVSPSSCGSGVQSRSKARIRPSETRRMKSL